MADKDYVPTGTHNDKSLNANEKALVDGYKRDWELANAAGDKAGMERAHAAAERVRANSADPYSGGLDGSEYNPLEKNGTGNWEYDPSTGTRASGGQSGNNSVSGGYSPAKLPEAQSQEAYIKAIYDEQQELQLRQLKDQYEQNVLSLDDAAAKIPAKYDAARNMASSDNEIAKAAFNERAAAHGLSSGTGSQSTLSMNNALLGSLSSASREEAGALSDIELSRVQLQNAYSSNISKAISENNLEKAAALYKELVRLDEANYSRALAQANENYKAYSSSK